MDPRYTRLAELLVHHSCSVQRGEKVFIEAIDIPHTFTSVLIDSVSKAGGVPYVKLGSNVINRSLHLHATEASVSYLTEAEVLLMQQADCYIGMRGSHNVSELSDIPEDKKKLFESIHWKQVHQDIRVSKTKWVVLRWPTPSMAQLADQSTEAFEEFYFNVCGLDYEKMRKAMQPLVDLMNKTDKVHLKGPGKTDLHFSIKDIPTIPCFGKRNIPDGEVFTAPVRDSLNGVIAYNTPSLYRGVTYDNVCFVCEKGKIVEATAGAQTETLNKVLDSDEGARYFGEFAIGVNPCCTKPMKDILFDEKIGGSIHLTPGNAYQEADNGNTSLVHWDLVLRQTEEVGGGEIYFDGELIRKNGLFVKEELKGLNPDRLLS